MTVSAVVTNWWWVRHAPVPGMDGRLYGATDLDCDCSDTAAFQRLAEILPQADLVVVSALKRTRQTLDAIVAGRQAIGRDAIHPYGAPLAEPAFSEQRFGLWQGLTWEEMRARDPHAYARFWRDPTRSAPPAGESFLALIGRVRGGIDALNAAHAGASIVCVGHAGSIRAAIATALGLGPEKALAVAIDTLSVTHMSHSNAGGLHGHGSSWTVHGINIPTRWISPKRV